MTKKKKSKKPLSKKSKRKVKTKRLEGAKSTSRKKAAKKKKYKQKPSSERKSKKDRKRNKRSSSQVGARARAVRQEALREQMDGKRYLRQIQGDFETLSDLHDDVKSVKNSGTSPFKVRNVVEKAKVQHTILKTKIDTNFRRLAKVLPDVKAIEISDPDGNNPLIAFATVMKDLLDEDLD